MLLAGQPNQRKEAIAQYEAAIRLKPDYADAHYNLACLLAQQPETQDEAARHFEAALRLKPAQPQTHFRLASLLSTQTAKHEQAIVQYVQALALQPGFPDAQAKLEELLSGMLRQPAAAVAPLEAALRDVRDAPHAFLIHYYLGLVLKALPDRGPAAAWHFREAARLNPEYLPATEALRATEAQ